MKLTVIGSGDAFGSGGRLQSCYHVSTDGGEFLIDCGATTIMGFNRASRSLTGSARSSSRICMGTTSLGWCGGYCMLCM